VDDTVLWHDVECDAYAADLPAWRALAAAAPGPVLDLGCGSGRVALELAAHGADVTGLDCEPALVRALAARARERGLGVRAEMGDARAFALERRFALVIAPMQVVQLLGGPDGRRAGLGCAARHLAPGGLIAIALADPFEGQPVEDALPPFPDMREEAGWVFSSLPLAVRAVGGPAGDAVAIERLRSVVSPAGVLSESLAEIRLELVNPAELEELAWDVGLVPVERVAVPETEAYVGSTIVVLEEEKR